MPKILLLATPIPEISFAFLVFYNLVTNIFIGLASIDHRVQYFEEKVLSFLAALTDLEIMLNIVGEIV